MKKRGFLYYLFSITCYIAGSITATVCMKIAYQICFVKTEYMREIINLYLVQSLLGFTWSSYSVWKISEEEWDDFFQMKSKIVLFIDLIYKCFPYYSGMAFIPLVIIFGLFNLPDIIIVSIMFICMIIVCFFTVFGSLIYMIISFKIASKTNRELRKTEQLD